MSEATVPTIPFADLPQTTASLSEAELVAVLNNTTVARVPATSFADGYVSYVDMTSAVPTAAHAMSWTSNGILVFDGGQWRKAPFYGPAEDDLTATTRFLLVNTAAQGLSDTEKSNARTNLGISIATTEDEGLVRIAAGTEDTNGVVTAGQMVAYVTGIADIDVVNTVTSSSTPRQVPNVAAVYNFVLGTSNSYSAEQTFTEGITASHAATTEEYSGVPSVPGLWANTLLLAGSYPTITFKGTNYATKLTSSASGLFVNGSQLDTVAAREAAVYSAKLESNTYADGKITQTIEADDTTHAPSGKAVYDYLQSHGTEGAAVIVYSGTLPQTGEANTLYVAPPTVAPSSYSQGAGWIYAGSRWFRTGPEAPAQTVYSGDTTKAPSGKAVYEYLSGSLSELVASGIVTQAGMEAYALAKTDVVSYAWYSGHTTDSTKAISPAVLTAALSDFTYTKGFPDGLEVGGPLDATGGLSVGGDAVFVGEATFGSTATYNGDVTINGTLRTYSGVQMGSLEVGGIPVGQTYSTLIPAAMTTDMTTYSVSGVQNARWIAATGATTVNVTVNVSYIAAVTAQGKAAVQYLSFGTQLQTGSLITVNYLQVPGGNYSETFTVADGGVPVTLMLVQDAAGRICTTAVSNIQRGGSGSPYSTLQVFEAGIEVRSGMTATDLYISGEVSFSVGASLSNLPTLQAPTLSSPSVTGGLAVTGSTTFSGSSTFKSTATFLTSAIFSGTATHHGATSFYGTTSFYNPVTFYDGLSLEGIDVNSITVGGASYELSHYSGAGPALYASYPIRESGNVWRDAQATLDVLSNPSQYLYEGTTPTGPGFVITPEASGIVYDIYKLEGTARKTDLYHINISDSNLVSSSGDTFKVVRIFDMRTNDETSYTGYGSTNYNIAFHEYSAGGIVSTYRAHYRLIRADTKSPAVFEVAFCNGIATLASVPAGFTFSTTNS